MGCASSKRQHRCRHCRHSYSPVHRRSFSMHAHHPPQNRGDSYHLVALTSSTLGSVKLDSSDEDIHINAAAENGYCDTGTDCHAVNCGNRSKEFSPIEARTWSNMIEEKIPKFVPKTPTETPPGEPETINTWELMEGLEDTSPLRPVNYQRSFSFDHPPKEISVSIPPISDRPQSPHTKPLWLQMANDDLTSISDPNSKSIISSFDTDLISTFKKALERLSPAKVSPRSSVHNEVGDAHQAFDDMPKLNGDANACKLAPLQKTKVVFYFTSLRGVRKTYEDCCYVRTILKGSGFRIDERDVSMHSGFKEELKELLGSGFRLPRVFVGGKHIGGAEEARRMHEEGQLEKALEGCERDDGSVCEACGDMRFVPCETCSGSCKVYYDGEEDGGGGGGGDGGENESDEYGFRRCPDCNENGIRRCPICCQ